MPGINAGVAAYKWGAYATALREWRPLAEQGNAKAQYNLGLMYRKGQGVPQDDAQALQWWRKAAEQGNAGAQNNIGFMYYNGRGVPEDDAQAHMWFNLASSRYPPGTDRDRAVKNRDIIAKRMTPAQISEAEKLARSGSQRSRGLNPWGT